MANTNQNPTKFLLAVPCVGCDEFFYAPLPLDQEDFAHHLVAGNWFLSVLTPVGHKGPGVIGALCPECAKETYSAEVIQATIESRSKLVLH
jgi:hypothetical protein